MAAGSAHFTGHLALLVEADVLQRLRAGSGGQEAKLLKRGGRGTWLKSSTLATLTIQMEPGQAVLSVSFRGEIIWRCATPDNRLTYCLLSPEATGVGCWLLAAAFTEGPSQVRRFCFRFSQHGGLEGGAHCCQVLKVMQTAWQRGGDSQCHDMRPLDKSSPQGIEPSERLVGGGQHVAAPAPGSPHDVPAAMKSLDELDELGAAALEIEEPAARQAAIERVIAEFMRNPDFERYVQEQQDKMDQVAAAFSSLDCT